MSEHPETLSTFLTNVISYVISTTSPHPPNIIGIFPRNHTYVWINQKSNISDIFNDKWSIGFSNNYISISREIQGKGMLHRCGDCDLFIIRREKDISDVFVKSPEYLLGKAIEAYDELNTMLDDKVFCKITRHFVDKDLYDIRQETAQLFGYKGSDECCVCSEFTSVKTECRHPLCLECWAKLKKNNNYKRQCPMCRQDIRCANIECPYHPDNDEDDEEYVEEYE